MTEPRVFVDEVAMHLGTAGDWVYRLLGNKNLPAHKIGRLWKFRISEVVAWVRDRGVEAEQARPRR